MLEPKLGDAACCAEPLSVPSVVLNWQAGGMLLLVDLHSDQQAVWSVLDNGYFQPEILMSVSMSVHILWDLLPVSGLLLECVN